MRKRMNNQARPGDWKVAAAEFLVPIWRTHYDRDYVFVGTKEVGNDRWREHAFQLPVEVEDLVIFFEEFDRQDFDLYFCANSFEANERKKVNARSTRFACVDVDDAPLERFVPPPSISWRTSPGRHQAIWCYGEPLPVHHIEQIAKDLAYDFGADKNGWSVTKCLRVPHTFNHKPRYDRPLVRLINAPSDPFEFALDPPEYQCPTERKPRRSNKTVRKRRRGTYKKKIARGQEHRRRILKKYHLKLTLMPRSLLGHDRLLYPDRSDAIYAMVAGLYEVGAMRDEIDVAIWNSIYFLDKYGEDRRALETEVSRIVHKLEAKR
ncbi:DNA-primase RepB domain-containing protein [Ruegeria sp. HKCCD7318]|uniref:DNA-primase RepB domain-containing protein n=1 Tax=Ruegeria sp. HKCCD7318 TaxID=2683014 RepID=UPI0014918748|nr:DNA-primase RepB domain-containing protein [Ruegeria sp. HKCCD7318]NOE32177.1 hypothetical protein [Ruegeria sp. HKCCD7318]